MKVNRYNSCKHYQKILAALNQGSTDKQAKERFVEIFHLMQTVDLGAVSSDFPRMWEHWNLFSRYVEIYFLILRGEYDHALYETHKLIRFFPWFCISPGVWYNIVDIISVPEGGVMFNWTKNQHLHENAYITCLKAWKRGFSFKSAVEDRKRDILSESCSRSCYERSLGRIELMLEHAEDSDSRCDLLEFLMHMIKNDIKYDCLANVIYEEAGIMPLLKFCFPMHYYDLDGQEHRLKPIGQTEVDFSKNYVFSTPWHLKRTPSNFLYLKDRRFQQDETNHLALYYRQINFCHVYNGHHSTMTGLYKGQGQITADEIDMTPLFEHVYTDGADWYCQHTHKVLDQVFDFRFALLFELGRRKVRSR